MWPITSITSGKDNTVPSHLVLDTGLISAIALLAFFYSSVGYSGSDDAAYISAAQKWVVSGPFVSNFFGDLRYPVILPISLSIILFGNSEISVTVPTLSYTLGTVLVTYWGMRWLADRTTALLVVFLITISPLLGGLATTVNDDVCELFFITVSIFGFLLGVQNKARWYIFFASGVSAGLAFMSRESTLSLLLFYGILFLINYGNRRSVFWIMAGGFISIFCGEMTVYMVTIGDPLYRMHLVAAAVRKPDAITAVGLSDLSSASQDLRRIAQVIHGTNACFGQVRSLLDKWDAHASRKDRSAFSYWCVARTSTTSCTVAALIAFILIWNLPR